MTHRAHKVVADALCDGAVRQEEGGSAAMLICQQQKKKKKKKRGQPDLDPPRCGGRRGVRRNVQTRRRGNDGREEEEEGEEGGRRLTLVADGVVPEGAGALVLGALQVALPGGGGVLELLVTVVAVVLPQRHL